MPENQHATTKLEAVSHQPTRNNHYVPQWYQRGFLKPGQSQLEYLNLAPDLRVHADGRQVHRTDLHRWGPVKCFREHDLYTTQFGPVVNDDIERKLFGPIDAQAAKAVKAFIGEDEEGMHFGFEDFFEHLASQMLRTPKGLDWIRSRYAPLDQVELMTEMQALRFLHCTMWAEGVREIVTADESDVKFIVTDHPVTVYNASIPPDSHRCTYPGDPPVHWLGTQSVYALDANTCLILTHLELAEHPQRTDLTLPRTNARHTSGGLVRTDNFIRKRALNRQEVISINHLLKSRARRFVAAAERSWLYPELEFNGKWSDIARVLLPKDDLWKFGGETFVRYEDGRSGYWDAYGRTTKAHEFHSRPALRSVGPNDRCGCGSGRKFKKCCQLLEPDNRPSWTLRSARERNLALLNAVNHILGFNDGATWEDVRRNLSDDQVSRLHEVYAFLWSEDTDLSAILPRPNEGVFRSVYFGFSDPRTVEATVLGWLTYFDEVILVHPFLLANRLKPDFSPVTRPSAHKLQLLKNVSLLLALEPFIRNGLVHVIPDPSDVSGPLGEHAREVLTHRLQGWTPPQGSLFQQLELPQDDFRRASMMLPRSSRALTIRKYNPSMDDAAVEKLLDYMDRKTLDDPLALLQPFPSGSGGQFQIMKGLSLEAALYLATLTGSVLHTDTEAYWEQLTKYAQPTDSPSDPKWQVVVEALGAIRFPIELNLERIAEVHSRGARSAIRATFRRLAKAVEARRGDVSPAQLADEIAAIGRSIEVAWSRNPEGRRAAVRLQLHVPTNGFGRHEVQRLLVMFANSTRYRPVPFAFKLIFEGL